MSIRARLLVVAVVLAALGPIAWILLAGDARPERPAAMPTSIATPNSAIPIAPPPLSRHPGVLEARLARATELARDLDPRAGALLNGIVDDATTAGEPAIAKSARLELDRLRNELVRDARDTAKFLRDEAAALVAEKSPAAVTRLLEAIAAARVIGENEQVAALEKELDAFRGILSQQAANARAELIRNAPRDDGSDDPDEEVRKGFDELARGEMRHARELLQRVFARIWNGTLDAPTRLRAIALLRRIVDLAREDPWSRGGPTLDDFELMIRFDCGGRAIQQGDGGAALELLDLAKLTPLDGRLPSSPHVLYLLGRAYEANGQPDDARKHYLAAIGTQTWLAVDAPIEVLRWLARRRALDRAVSKDSPGVGAQWQRFERRRFVLFHELEEGAGKLARRVEGARDGALARLAWKDSVRLEPTKPVVFAFANEGRYRASGLAPRAWAGAHMEKDTLEDGSASTICVFAPATPELDATLTHEWAHALVAEHLRDALLPSWAVEGVAAWAEPESRARYRIDGAPIDWRAFLKAWRDARYVGSNAGAAWAFYTQAELAFETTVARLGSADAALQAAGGLLKKESAEKKEETPFATLGFKDEADWSASVAKVVAPPK